MAKLEVSEKKITLRLSRIESIFALHTSPSSQIDHILAITPVNNFWNRLMISGIRFGTGIPFFVALGTFWWFGSKSFIAVYKSQPGYLITFKDGEYTSWKLSSWKLPQELEKFLIPIYK
jgi:hypothetical protein